MPALLLPVALTLCLAHPVELDREVGRRAMPWLPPDLARQIERHERDFARGAAAAAAWPAPHHVPGTPDGVEATLALQCRRIVVAIRSRTAFSEVVAGLGAVAHLCLDLNHPFAGPEARSAYAHSFAELMRATTPRIPLVFYGQDPRLLYSPGEALEEAVRRRRLARPSLGSIVREDMDRVGGPRRWPALDDRSSSFGAASLVLNHAASDFTNLASWVWRAAGGLVPEIPMEGTILVWRGEARPREARPAIRIRQVRR